MAAGIVRTTLGITLGLLVMFVAIMAIEFVGHRLYPPPTGLDPMQPGDLARIMAAQPFMAKLMVVVAWVAGAFAGGWVAAKVARDWPRVAAVAVAAVVVAAVIGMVVQLPDHPRWMAALGVLLPIPAAWWAARLARPRNATRV